MHSKNVCWRTEWVNKLSVLDIGLGTVLAERTGRAMWIWIVWNTGVNTLISRPAVPCPSLNSTPDRRVPFGSLTTCLWNQKKTVKLKDSLGMWQGHCLQTACSSQNLKPVSSQMVSQKLQWWQHQPMNFSPLLPFSTPTVSASRAYTTDTNPPVCCPCLWPMYTGLCWGCDRGTSLTTLRIWAGIFGGMN